MVIWKERKHDNDDAFAKRKAGCIATLRDCLLLKFFVGFGNNSKPELLVLWGLLWFTRKHKIFMIKRFGDFRVTID